MKIIFLSFSLMLWSFMPSMSQQASEKKELLQVVQQFFDALEKQDTLAWNKIFLKDARNFYLVERDDSIRTGMQDPFSFRSKPGEIIKERMRDSDVTVQVHQNIAAVWAPYDLWINDTYSHCGVDVFTLLKSSEGWKIASLSFTMEKEGCGNIPQKK
ncbi:MAG: nuclear transport factor 2 family protein [Bacteroidota bacterium]|nr:nuclear transport factor 2 family protein [Bacteroidota bacterium]